MRFLWFGLVVVCIPLSTALAREPSNFLICDGFEAPSSSSDGLMFRLKNPFAVNNPKPMLERIRACSDALASPLLVENQFARRISLLESRAIMHLLTNAMPDAAADIDAASQLGSARRNDPSFQRSTVLGFEMMRAVLDAHNRNSASSQRRWALISERRPFDLTVQSVALQYLRASAAPLAVLGPVIHRLILLDPYGRDAAIDTMLDLGHATEALEIFHKLPGPSVATLTSPNYSEDSITVQVARHLTETERRARLAYAAAAKGDTLLANTLLDSAGVYGKSLTDAMPTKGSLTKQLIPFLLTKDRVETQSRQAGERWSELIAVRNQLRAGKPVNVQAIIGSPTFVHEEAILLSEVLASRPAQENDNLIAARVDLIRIRLGEHANAYADPALVFAQLPEIEYQGSLPKTIAKVGKLSFSPDGFLIDSNSDGTKTIIYTASFPRSVQLSQELSILSAAIIAASEGKRYFSIYHSSAYDLKNSSGYMISRNATVRVKFLDDSADPRAIATSDVIEQFPELLNDANRGQGVSNTLNNAK